MRNYTRTLTTLAFLATTVFGYSQCRCNHAEYKHIIDSTPNLDPIVGLYGITGYTQVYNEVGEKVYSSEGIDLDYMYILPDGPGKFKLCHTELTEYQPLEASYTHVAENIYTYKFRIDGDKFIEAEAELLLDTLNDGKVVNYIRYGIPASKEEAVSKGIMDASESLYWVYVLAGIDVDRFYKVDEAYKEELYQYMKDQYNTSNLTEEELKEIEATANGPSVALIRNTLNTGEIFNLPGGNELPDTIADDQFFVIFVNSDFPNIQTYHICFKANHDYVYTVDFDVDDDWKPLSIRSIQIDHNFNKQHAEAIILAGEPNTFWR